MCVSLARSSSHPLATCPKDDKQNGGPSFLEATFLTVLMKLEHLRSSLFG